MAFRNEVRPVTRLFERVYPETLRPSLPRGGSGQIPRVKPWNRAELSETAWTPVKEEELRAALQEVRRLRLVVQERDAVIASLRHDAIVGCNHD